MIRFLLCRSCRTAWTSTAAPSPARDYCHGAAPIDCSPWSADARAWFRAAVTGWRASQVAVVASYSNKRELAELLGRGVVARGRTWAVAA